MAYGYFDSACTVPTGIGSRYSSQSIVSTMRVVNRFDDLKSTRISNMEKEYGVRILHEMKFVSSICTPILLDKTCISLLLRSEEGVVRTTAWLRSSGFVASKEQASGGVANIIRSSEEGFCVAFCCGRGNRPPLSYQGCR